MRIAILGTRGIPNNYGGFEYFAQNMAERLALSGHEVFVFEPAKQKMAPAFFGKAIRHSVKTTRWLPENIRRLQYDYRSLKEAYSVNPSLILKCGYSHAVFLPFMSPSFRNKIITNVDGLEWKRGKWRLTGKLFLLLCEFLTARLANNLVADNKAIKYYWQKKYSRDLKYISYGAIIPEKIDIEPTLQLGLIPNRYLLTIARLEPENSIAEIIEAAVRCGRTLVIVGSVKTPLGKRLQQKYQHHKTIIFLGGIYDNNTLNSLRAHCEGYIHGHSVGGTNPSLLEAMACGSYIIAHDNPFNREVIGSLGKYFSGIRELINEIEKLGTISAFEKKKKAAELIRRIELNYQWDRVVSLYIDAKES